MNPSMNPSMNNCTMIFILFGILIFFTIILPMVDTKYENFEKYDKVVNVSQNDLSMNNKIDMNECSFNCCKHIQYLPDEIKKIKENKNKKYDDFISSNISCNGGCICLNKNNFDFLSSRGGNI